MEDAKRLKQIREEMIDLFEEAKNIVNRSPDLTPHDRERAKAYWIGHIEEYLTEEKSPVHVCTMFETVESIGGFDEYDEDAYDAENPESHDHK